MTRITHILWLGVLLFPCGLNAQNSTTPSIAVLKNNVSGGGFQSDVTITDDGLTVYSSADVSGVFKSTNGGLSFENINEGLRSTKVASLAISPDNDKVLYAGTGDKGSSGGLFRSTDGGGTWALTADGEDAQFAGNHSADSDPVPDGHARSNGDLIVVDSRGTATHRDDIVVAGTYKDGVVIFRDGGDRKASAVFTNGGFVRSVAYHPDNGRIAYAAIQFANNNRNESGIYRIDFTNPSRPISSLEYPTDLPEGLTVLSNGNVYAAITTGIVRFNGSRWSLRNGKTVRGMDLLLDTDNPKRQWTAVTGYVNTRSGRPPRDIVYAGANNQGGTKSGKDYSTVWRTINGGSTWVPLVDVKTNVSDQIYGKSHDWWYRTDAFTQGGLGRKNSIVSSIDVARGNSLNNTSDDVVYVSGRGGIWRYETADKLWQPAVNNMQGTSNRGVAVNPNDPTQVVLGNTDYVLLETGNGFKNSDLSRDKPAESESRGYDVIFDAKSDQLILGTGDRDRNEAGEVFVKSADKVGNRSVAWKNTLLKSATNSADGRAIAVAYGYHTGRSSTTQTILAAVEGEGVYRYHRGRWSKSRGVNIGSSKRSNFVWPDNENSGVVYLLDLDAGLYRSNDGGRNWRNMWPAMSFNNNDFFNTGYITADDNDPTTLYLSVQGGKGSPINTGFKVYRLTDADVGVFGNPDAEDRITDLTNSEIKRPGPIVFGPNGYLWLTQQQDSKNGVDAGFFVMKNPATGVSFTEITTKKYRGAAVSPSGIDVSNDGHLYISQGGIGVVKMAVTYPRVLLGDVNRDGVVNRADTKFFWDVRKGLIPYREEADFNQDGEITYSDILEWRILIRMVLGN